MTRIVTWNVNSLKARLPRVEEWINYAQPDILCVQETKMTDEAFPTDAFAVLGYESVHHGQGRWNGVAIISRVGISEVSSGFGDLEDPYEGDARLIAATCGGLRVVNVYVPNGREVPSEFYDRKLLWLKQLRTWLAATSSPQDSVVVVGDFNVAPEDRDVWSMKAFKDSTHVTKPERETIAALEDWGLIDTFRQFHQEDQLYSFWDYRGGDFHKHHGMRIDLVLASKSVAEKVTGSVIDRNARKGQQPSDHAPVIVDLDN